MYYCLHWGFTFPSTFSTMHVWLWFSLLIKQVFWSKKCLLSFCGRIHIHLEVARWRIYNLRTWHQKMKLTALVCQLKLLKTVWKRASVPMGLCLRSVFKWIQSTFLAIKFTIVRQLKIDYIVTKYCRHNQWNYWRMEFKHHPKT